MLGLGSWRCSLTDALDQADRAWVTARLSPRAGLARRSNSPPGASSWRRWPPRACWYWWLRTPIGRKQAPGLPQPPGRAHRRQARRSAPADLLRATRPQARQGPAQGLLRGGLRPSPGRRAASNSASRSWSPGSPRRPVSRAMTDQVAARDWLTAYQLRPYARGLNRSSWCGSTSSDPWSTWPTGTSAS